MEARSRAADEAREESSARVAEATLPLVRQIEGMAAQMESLEASAASAQREKGLSLTRVEAALQEAEDRCRKAEASRESAERRAARADRAVTEVRQELVAAEAEWGREAGERKVRGWGGRDGGEDEVAGGDEGREARVSGGGSRGHGGA